jgi:hypothetical protein
LRRNANRHVVVWHVANHDSTCANNTVLADLNALDDGRTDADVGALTHGHFASQLRAHRDVTAAADDRVVFDNRTGIHDHVFIDESVDANDCSGENLSAFEQVGRITNDCGVGNYLQEVEAGFGELLETARRTFNEPAEPMPLISKCSSRSNSSRLAS